MEKLQTTGNRPLPLQLNPQGARDDVLAANGARPTLHPGQLGSGTFDLRPGVTYKARSGALDWGTQYKDTFRLGDNDEDYTLADVHQVSTRGSDGWTPAATTSLRVTGRTGDSLSGIDPQIVAPGQTADPDFQGGERVDFAPGLNFAGQTGTWRGIPAAVGRVLPADQDLNCPQMQTHAAMLAGAKPVS